MNSYRHLLLVLSASFALSGCHGKNKIDETILSRPEPQEHFSEKTKEKIRKANLNKVGTIANDFRYIDREGHEGSLHELKSKRLLLIFYNPECPHCAPLLKKKATDRRLNDMIDKGELTILAVYAEGDRDVWENTKHELPDNWIVAYDLTGILDRDLYDLPVMPIAYALSADKRVAVKDVPW